MSLPIVIKNNNSGDAAGVTKDNQLRVLADSVPVGAFTALNKTHWTVSSGTVNLTSANKSAILYLEYTGTSSLVLDAFNLTTGTSTGGAAGAQVQYELVRNPTSGTIVSIGTKASVFNRNFSGVSGSLGGSQFSGVEGATITDGDTYGLVTTTNSAGLQTFDINSRPVVLETGNSIGFNFTPPDSNTSMDIRVFLFVYEINIT